VSVATKVIAAQGLARRAFSLGAVKAFDNAMQFLLPVVLVRCLDAATFGEYRLLWLAVGTLLAFAAFGMPGALYYFLPRSDAPMRRLYVHQTVLFLAATGLVAALFVSPLNPWLPATLAPLTKYGALVPAFVLLWIVTVLLDSLPTVEERIPLQAYATMSTAATRFVLLGAGAWLTGELAVILWLLVAVALLKLALLVGYVQRFHGWQQPWFRRAAFTDQVAYAAPFGAASGLFTLRGQADQWIAATLFSLHSFAAFSVGAILGQVVHVVRTSVLEVFMPSMSRLEAGGDTHSMLEMNARANEMVAWALFPFLAFAFAFAPDIVTLVYTAAYLDAATVMRVYIAGLALMVIELTSVLQLLRQGPFALAMNAFTLLLSVPLSWYAGVQFGLPGAAAGSVTALYVDRLVTLQRIARLSGVRVAHQQHWGGLGGLLALAALAGLAAWALAHWAFAEAALPVRLAAGFFTLSAPYLLATRRRWKR
jgi:O-antigen/teichoic acid export membrane protein